MADGGFFSSTAQEIASVAGVSAEPFAVNGLFGWFHSEPKQASRDVAVLICGALSREALDSHHSLRVLADAFAQAGYPTMRFDYAGAGDSADPAPAGVPTEFWSIWQGNIHEAADRLRRTTGARRLILCGLRIGATLAALAAESREDIAGLILLAPVLRGRSYLRQLQMEGDFAHGKAAAKTGGLEFQELSLSRETVDLISGVDLRRVKLGRGLKVAVFSQTPTRPLAECLSAWAEQGADIDSYGFDGLEPLCCPDTQGYKEPAAAAAMIEWMDKATPSQPLLSNLGLQCGGPGLPLPGCVETPVRFGPDQRLFGILTRPEGKLSEIAMIIVNTGRSPRAGLGRFGVEFARKLAAGGITTLRFDFAGLGDSIGPAGQENMRSDVFEDDRSGDISAAIDTLAQLGCRRFVVHGICSGAYHGLHAAAADPRIEAVLMVNLPLFLWKTGDSIAESKKRSYAFSHYRTRLMEPAHWLRLLRGESDVLGIIKGQLPRLAAFFRWPGKSRAHGQARDPVAFARALMAGLSRRRARTLFLFDPDHAGAYEIQNLFGKGGAGLNSYAGAEIKMVAGLGDAVGESAARQEAAGIMIGFIAAL
jgi:alpha-beta hydrolase superfamily lysophospholipase